MNKPRLIVLIGPTAVGKTALAIELAEKVNGEIVSADSRLFYRGMDIGTAKPSQVEQSRVPHHLIDVTEPDKVWSLPVFQQAASEAIKNISLRKKIPILVGGTGQYVRAVVEGWVPPVQPPDDRLRAALEQWGRSIGAAELHRRLGIVDAAAAAVIEPSNLRRTIRALEVMILTGQRFSEQRQRIESAYDYTMIGLMRPRSELYARIDERIRIMLQTGLVDEVRRLLANGYSPDLPPLSAIGYREMIAVIKGRMTLDEAVVLMKRLTRQFVRRQANWFKPTDANIHWFEMSDTTVTDILAFLKTIGY
jgi:tRNA dimethylallyltransferase